MTEGEEPLAFISRDLSPDWPRYRGHVESEEPQPHLIEEGPGWNELDKAISWGRARAPEVYVRLGATGATYYSAGEVDPRADPDYPDDVVPPWPPNAERLHDDLNTIRRSLEGLSAADRQTWCEAAHELGAHRVSEAVEPLIEALKSPDLEILRAAVVALLDLADKRAISPLRALLEADPESDRFVAAFYAARALSCFDDPEAREASAWRASRVW